MKMLRAQSVKPPRASTPSHPSRPDSTLLEGTSIAAHLQELSEQIGPRPAGSAAAQEARRYLEHTIRTLGALPQVWPFPMVIPQYQHCRLGTNAGRVISFIPALGTPSTAGVVRGVPAPWWEAEGAHAQASRQPRMLLCPIGTNATSFYTRLAVERNAAGVILYKPDVPALYSEVLPVRGDSIPCVTVCRADADWLAQERPSVELNMSRGPAKISCTNILVQLGTLGPPLLIAAHYDTRPHSPGALCNASGIAVLLALLARVRDWQGPRILLAFLDAEELNAAGSRHCRDALHVLGTLKDLRGVVYLSEVGQQGLAILPSGDNFLPPQSRAAGQFDLLRNARQCALAEKMRLCDDTSDPPVGASIPQGIWPCPTIALTGPPTPVRHTTADLPLLIDSKSLLATAAALERLLHASRRHGLGALSGYSTE